jgi:sporulation protein YlmC with PRC-barrel domain
MGSTYTDNGGIEKIGLGEQAGAWGTTTNNNFDIIDRLINGVTSISLTGTTHTLTTSDGSLSEGMFKVLVLGGSPSGTNTITIEPNNADKLYFVKNASGQSVTFTQGSGADVTILNGNGAIIFADGAGSGAAVTDLTALFVVSNAIDNVAIGGTTPAAITGTTITATTSILPDASGGADIGSTSAEFGDIYVADDKKIKFGSDQDITMEYDEDDTDTLLISRATSGTDLITIADDKKVFFGTGKDVSLEYDEDDTDTILVDRSSGAEVITIADDKKVFFGTNKDVSLEYDEDDTDSLLISGGDVTIADDKKLNFGTGKDVSIEYDEDGNDTMLITGDVTFADGTTDVDIASHDGTNGLKLGGTLVTRTAAQINSARDGTVTSVSGGTGLSGTVTSSGSISLNTGIGEVGTYAFLARQGYSTINAGQTYTNSSSGATNNSANLVYAGFLGEGDNNFDDDTALDSTGSSTTTGLTGVWRAMGEANATSRVAATLFLRIS